MSDFEFLFALFGLLFGLIIAELSIKFADAIDSDRDCPIGVLTPALAFLLLTDATSFWLLIWAARGVLFISWRTVFSGVLLAMVYFVAASLVFPRTGGRWGHLDDHYWARKRPVAGAILFVNLVTLAAFLTQATPAWNDWWFYYWIPSYDLALVGLMVSRSRRLDLLFLAWVITLNIAAGFHLLPNSHWAKQIGVAFTQH
jgi:hypothetical protein